MINKPLNLRCDVCGKEFILKSVDDIITKDHYVGDKKLILSYFSCPCCNHNYKIAILDDQCVELRNKINMVIKRMNKKFNKGMIAFLEKGVKADKIKLDMLMANLETKYNWVFTSLTQETEKQEDSTMGNMESKGE